MMRKFLSGIALVTLLAVPGLATEQEKGEPTEKNQFRAMSLGSLSKINAEDLKIDELRNYVTAYQEAQLEAQNEQKEREELLAKLHQLKLQNPSSAISEAKKGLPKNISEMSNGAFLTWYAKQMMLGDVETTETPDHELAPALGTSKEQIPDDIQQLVDGFKVNDGLTLDSLFVTRKISRKVTTKAQHKLVCSLVEKENVEKCFLLYVLLNAGEMPFPLFYKEKKFNIVPLICLKKIFKSSPRELLQLPICLFEFPSTADPVSDNFKSILGAWEDIFKQDTYKAEMSKRFTSQAYHNQKYRVSDLIKFVEKCPQASLRHILWFAFMDTPVVGNSVTFGTSILQSFSSNDTMGQLVVSDEKGQQYWRKLWRMLQQKSDYPEKIEEFLKTLK